MSFLLSVRLFCLFLNVCIMDIFSFFYPHEKAVFRPYGLPAFSSIRGLTWRGVLTLTWYTYMCLSFGVLFREIWYSDWGFHQRQRCPNYITWVYFGQIIVKSTQFGQNWVHFFREWYTDGWEIGQKIDRESQIFEVYFGQIIVKSTQFGQNWMHFFRKWYTDGWEIGQKIDRESQIFEVRQAHPHTILVRVSSLMQTTAVPVLSDHRVREKRQFSGHCLPAFSSIWALKFAGVPLPEKDHERNRCFIC